MNKTKIQSVFLKLFSLLLLFGALFGLIFIFLFSNNSKDNSNLKNINQGLVVNQPEQVGKIRSNYDHNFSYLLLSDGGYIVANDKDLSISRIDNFGNVLWQYSSILPQNLKFKIVSVVQNPNIQNQFYVLSIPTVEPANQYNFINDPDYLARMTILSENLSSSDSSILTKLSTTIITPSSMIKNIPLSWTTGTPTFLLGSDLVKPDKTFGYSYDLYIANMGGMSFYNNDIFLFGSNNLNNSPSLGVYRLSNFTGKQWDVQAWPYAYLIESWKDKPATQNIKNSDFPIFEDDNFTYAFRGQIAGISFNSSEPGVVTIGGIFTVGINNTISSNGSVLSATSNPDISSDHSIIGFFKLSLSILSEQNVLLKSASNSNWYNFGNDSFEVTRNEILKSNQNTTNGLFSVLNVADFKQISDSLYVMQYISSVILLGNVSNDVYKFIPYTLMSEYNNWHYFVGLLVLSNSNTFITIWNNPTQASNNTSFYFFDLNKLSSMSDFMPEKINDLNLKIVNSLLLSPISNQFYLQWANDFDNLSGLNLVTINSTSIGTPKISINEDFSNSLKIRNDYLGYGEIKKNLSTDFLKLPVFQIIDSKNDSQKIQDKYVQNFINYTFPEKKYNPSPKIYLKVEDTTDNSIVFDSYVFNTLTNSYSKIPGLYSTYKFTGFNSAPPYVIIIIVSVASSLLAFIIVICTISGIYKRRKRILTKQKLVSKYKNI